MARLMRYMINYQGNRIISTVHIKLSKPVLYSLVPPMMEKAMTDGVCWECGLNILNSSAFPSGAVFYYTVDGSEPTRQSAVLTADTVIDRNCTVRMIAVYEETKVIRISASVGELIIDDLRNGMPIFWIRPNATPGFDPVIDGEAGELSAECTIDIQNKNRYPEGTKFVYTVDGSEPDENSPELPATIDHNCTVNVKVITPDNQSFTASVEINDLRNEMPEIEAIVI